MIHIDSQYTFFMIGTTLACQQISRSKIKQLADHWLTHETSGRRLFGHDSEDVSERNLLQCQRPDDRTGRLAPGVAAMTHDERDEE